MNWEDILRELKYKAVRSSGPGGQHVNKVSTKVEVSFDIAGSKFLNPDQKELLLNRLGSRLNSEGLLKLYASSSRSQLKNKKQVTQKLIDLLQEQLRIVAPRKKSTIPKQVIEKRLKIKKMQALKKYHRRPPDL